MVCWNRVQAGGPVSYDYEIMCDPVTNEEYCQWLNSLAKNEAELRYSKLMAGHFFGGINKVEGINGARYCVRTGFEHKPVVFVSWYDAQAYGKWAGGRLPTVNEWLKAAAWMPSEGRLAIWCTGSNKTPTQDEANFYDFEKGWALPAPHLADVDWYKPSGVYGCRGMAGNVAEWCSRELTGWQPALGGSLFRPLEFLRTNGSEADHPTKRLSTFGFRLVREVAK